MEMISTFYYFFLLFIFLLYSSIKVAKKIHISTIFFYDKIIIEVAKSRYIFPNNPSKFL